MMLLNSFIIMTRIKLIIHNNIYVAINIFTLLKILLEYIESRNI